MLRLKRGLEGKSGRLVLRQDQHQGKEEVEKLSFKLVMTVVQQCDGKFWEERRNS